MHLRGIWISTIIEEKMVMIFLQQKIWYIVLSYLIQSGIGFKKIIR